MVGQSEKLTERFASTPSTSGGDSLNGYGAVGSRSVTPRQQPWQPDGGRPLPQGAGASRTPTPHQWARDHALKRLAQTPPLNRPGVSQSFETEQACRTAPRPHSAFDHLTGGGGCARSWRDSRDGDVATPGMASSEPGGVWRQQRRPLTASRAASPTPGGIQALPPLVQPSHRSMSPSEASGFCSAGAEETLLLAAGDDGDATSLAGGFQELFRRRPPSQAEMASLRPSFTLPASPTSPSALQVMRAPPQAHPYGGAPRPGLRPSDVPPRPAAPQMRPHNAWCTFVEWTLTAESDEDPQLSYDLKCCEDSAEEATWLMEDLGKDPWVQVDGMETGRTYYFQVRARNVFGAGPWSFWSEGYTAPAPLKDCCRSNTSVGAFSQGATASMMAHAAVLQWEEPCSHGAQIVGYKVEYGTDPDDVATLKTALMLNRRTYFEVGDLLPNRLYYFRVRAINAVGESDWTAWSDGVTTKAVVPDTPSPPKLVEARPTELVVRWPMPFACGFEIKRWDVRIACDDPDMETFIEISNDSSNVIAASTGERELRLKDLEPITAYYLQVRAASAMGESAWSPVSAAMRTLPAVPDKIEGLHIVKNVVGSIVLEWAAPESYGLPIEAFMVRWSEEPRMLTESGNVEVPGPVGKNESFVGAGFACRVSDVRPGAKLFFQVAARSKAGSGPWSDVTEEIVACPDRPSVPSAPKVVDRTSTSIQVDAADDADPRGSPVLHYELRWGMFPHMSETVLCQGVMQYVPGTGVVQKGQGYRGQRVGKALPRIFRCAVTGLSARGAYYFQVRAVNAVGVSPWSAPSAAAYLHQSAPARMAAPTLHLAESTTSLLIKFVPPCDMGICDSGELVGFELRYCRKPEVLEDEDVDMEKPNSAGVVYMSLPLHAIGQLRSPDAVRVHGLITGRAYVFQVRATSTFGAAPWSEISLPFETLPSPPEKPVPITGNESIGSIYSFDLRMALPDPNGKQIQLCSLRVKGPYWLSKGSWRPRSADWRDLEEIDVDDCEEDFERSADTSETFEQIVTRVWTRLVQCLEPGATYRFRYSCANEVGWSDWSDPSGELTVQPTRPERCPPPQPIAEQALSATVQWTPPHDSGSDITHYTVEWASNPQLEKFHRIENVPDAICTIQGLTPNKNYYVRVAAHNAYGMGDFSEITPKLGVGVLHTASTEPGRVIKLSAQPVDKEAGAARVAWVAPKYDGGRLVSRYKLMYSLEADLSNCTEVLVKSVREIIVHALKPDMLYYFDVAAINLVGIGEYTGAPVSCKTNPVPPEEYVRPKRPAMPELSVFMERTVETEMHNLVLASKVRVAWKCPENYHPKKGFLYDMKTQTHPITHYSVRLVAFKEQQPEAEDLDLAVADQVEIVEDIQQKRDRRTVPLDDTNVVAFGGEMLLPGRWYYAAVQSFNTAGCSDWSEWSSMDARAPPGAPAMVTNLTLIHCTPTTLTVEWCIPHSNGEPIDHFHLRWREHPMVQGEPVVFDPSRHKSKSLTDALSDLEADRKESWSCIKLEWDDFDLSLEGLAKRKFTVSDADETQRRNQWTIDCLSHARHYLVKICAGNSIGTGPWCMSDPLRTASVPPTAPSPALGVSEEASQFSVTFAWEEPADLGGEPLLRYEVCWLRVAEGAPPPKDWNAVCDHASVKRFTLPPDQRSYAATHGMTPGDLAIAVVRAENCIGWSPWSRLPKQGAERESLRTLPAPPGSLVEPPRLERELARDHRPYTLTATWECPALNGRPIHKFLLRFFRVKDDNAADEDVDEDDFESEFYFEHPGYTQPPWFEGQRLRVPNVHRPLEPGQTYRLMVRATTVVGDAESWGPPSAVDRAPPDLPDKPAAPNSPWQWPSAIEITWVPSHMNGADCDGCDVRYALSKAMQSAVHVEKKKAFASIANKVIQVEHLPVDSDPYYFQIRVKNSVGWSAWSDPSEGFCTGACRPEVPFDLHAMQVDRHFIHVAWAPPADHGAKVTDYDVVLVETNDTALRAAVDQTNNSGLEAQDDQKMDDFVVTLPPKEIKHVPIVDLANAQAPELVFSDLLGGLHYSVTARARNRIGWSDWCPVLGPLRTRAAPPCQCPPLVLLEAMQHSLRVEYRLPYDNGDPITRMQVEWVRIIGPIDRHVALGGTVFQRARGASEGELFMDPRPGIEFAPPYGYGGSDEFTVLDLEPGTEYQMRIRAENAEGFGPYSFPVRIFCAPGKPDAPSRMRHISRTDLAAFNEAAVADQAAATSPSGSATFALPVGEAETTEIMELRPPTAPPPPVARPQARGARTINFAKITRAGYHEASDGSAPKPATT